MILATVYDTSDSPISDVFLVANDDFSGAEEFAASAAAAGRKCCIRWIRESDGQVAYWGPAGAAIKPRWYAKPGRPEEMQGGKRKQVYLDSASIAAAVALSPTGNVSEGIRIALSTSPRNPDER